MKNCLLVVFALANYALASAQPPDSTFLYSQCGNEISLTMLAPGYQPVKNGFELKGARLINNTDNDRIAILPDSAVVVIHLKGRPAPVILYAKSPPHPIFEVTINGSHYDSFSHDQSGPLPSSIQVDPVPDEAFRMVVPKDARYKIIRWEIVQRRGTEVVNRLPVTTATLPPTALNRIRSAARPGDVLVITVTQMKRQNAIGELIDQDLVENSLSYTIKE